MQVWKLQHCWKKGKYFRLNVITAHKLTATAPNKFLWENWTAKKCAFMRGTGRFTANTIADRTGVFNVILRYLWDNEQNVLYTVKHHKPSKQNASLKIAALLEKEKIFQVKRHHRPQIDSDCTIQIFVRKTRRQKYVRLWEERDVSRQTLLPTGRAFST